jgi:phosphatidylserine/phosphatidylglycerophosphate/cardiolipin synthase-like enzyme
MNIDLRDLHIPDDGRVGLNTGRPSGNCGSGNVTVMFDDLPSRCCDFISGADMITGCVAWLTNTAVLVALAKVSQVSIIVQKEDFLRPDNPGQYKADLHMMYSAIPGVYRYDIDGIMDLSCATDPDSEAIRCMGIHNSSQKRAVPRMHHKFLVRSKKIIQCSCDDYFCSCDHQWNLVPEAVWTGSFNMTYNGSRSLENALVIYDQDVASRYQREWAWIFGLSEPLDWRNEWVQPEYRLGT